MRQARQARLASGQRPWPARSFWPDGSWAYAKPKRQPLQEVRDQAQRRRASRARRALRLADRPAPSASARPTAAVIAPARRGAAAVGAGGVAAGGGRGPRDGTAATRQGEVGLGGAAGDAGATAGAGA